MLVTAMDINMTIINNNAGNGDGYKRDNKHIKYIHIYITHNYNNNNNKKKSNAGNGDGYKRDT